MLIIGFALGILSALFFTVYILPQKLARADTTTYLWMLGVGVMVTALVPYVIVGCPHAATGLERGAGLLCGVVWGIGTLCFAGSVDRIGLALAAPFKNTTGVVGTLVGLILLQEWKTTDPILCTIGSILIVAAAIVIGMTGKTDAPKRSAVGVAMALGAAVCYSSYLYPMKLVVARIGYWEFIPWMAAGILLTATFAVLGRPGGLRDFVSYAPRVYLFSLLGGVAWTLALICLSASMVMVDLSVAWSLAQLNTVPAVFLGILVFREIRFRDHKAKIIIGLLAATIGTVLLGMAKR